MSQKSQYKRKYVIFLRLKALKLALLVHFYCQLFCQSVENRTYFIKKIGNNVSENYKLFSLLHHDKHIDAKLSIFSFQFKKSYFRGKILFFKFFKKNYS